MTNYHLWFMPAGEVYDQLVGVIKEFSRRYEGPFFEPYVTLLGGVKGPEKEVLQKTESLAQGLRPFHIRLTTLAQQEHYFRALYLLVEETSHLLDAYTQAQTYFPQSSSSGFLPHLSLLYGTYSQTLKKEVIAGFKFSLPSRFLVSTLHIIHAPSRDPRDWSHAQTVSFRGNSYTH